MSGFLDKLREKTPEEKKKITIWAAVVITIMIIVLWITFFFPFGGSNAPAGSFLGDVGRGFDEMLRSAKK